MRHFAYGSNIDLEQLSSRIGRNVAPSERRHAFLHDYDLKFNKQAWNNPKMGYANVVRAPSRVVEGLVFNVALKERYKLDECEGYPEHYDRMVVTVQLDSGMERDAEMYVAKPKWGKSGLRPPKDYVDRLLTAEDLLTPGYCKMLRSIETLDQSSDG